MKKRRALPATLVKDSELVWFLVWHELPAAAGQNLRCANVVEVKWLDFWTLRIEFVFDVTHAERDNALRSILAEMCADCDTETIHLSKYTPAA